MRTSITITDINPVHTSFAIFVNGARAGSMVLRNEEFQPFLEMVKPDHLYDNSLPVPGINSPEVK